MNSPHGGRDLELAAQEVLAKIVGSAPQERERLRLQASHTRVTGGLVTMLTLDVAAGPRVTLTDGPLTVRADVTDQAGRPIGEIIVWVSDGYLSALEFAWWTDQPPSRLPPAAHVHIR